MQLITPILIALGALVMFISIITVSKLLKLIGKGKYRVNWQTLRYFMTAFLAGYLATIYIVFVADSAVLSLTGAVFFLGAVFVLAVTMVGRKTIEDLLETTVSRSYLDNIIHSMADTLIVIDTDKNATIKNVNNATLRLLKYKEEELAKKSIDVVLFEKSISEIGIEGLKKGEFILEKEISYKTKTGKEIPILFSASPLLNIHNDVEGIIFVGQDITFKKQAEEKIKSYLEQLEVSEAKLQELNSTKDKFFSIIAHDLKSPFNGFLNLTELMADSREKFSLEEFAEISKSLNQAARNLYKLLENLLEWSQVQKGSIIYTPKDIDLSKQVLQSVDTINPRAEQKGIIIINDAIDIHKVYADEKMISAVLRNLLSNAVKFTRTGGKVIVKSEQLNSGATEVSVTDDGVGIAEKDVKRLFKIEEKVSSQGTDGELSTGLGLLLCKEFVEKNGGEIRVESEEGNGSTFYFTIPSFQLNTAV